jgi:branched-chain amino acid aminotransferase
MKLWLNGALQAAESARIDPADRGFTLGDGVFETICVNAGQPLRLAQHLARFRAGAATLEISPVYDEAAITAAIAEVIAANHLQNAALRLTLSRGPAPRGLLPVFDQTPTLLITAADLPPPKPPARAIICTSTCRNEASPLSRIKSLNYLDSILALQEARRRGADEAILLNSQGRIAEASAANIFLIIQGNIRTPPVADGALPGIMRAALIARFGVIEASLTLADLRAAQAVFLSTALGLRAVASIDEQELDLQNPALRSVMALETRNRRIIYLRWQINTVR